MSAAVWEDHSPFNRSSSCDRLVSALLRRSEEGGRKGAREGGRKRERESEEGKERWREREERGRKGAKERGREEGERDKGSE